MTKPISSGPGDDALVAGWLDCGDLFHLRRLRARSESIAHISQRARQQLAGEAAERVRALPSEAVDVRVGATVDANHLLTSVACVEIGVGESSAVAASFLARVEPYVRLQCSDIKSVEDPGCGPLRVLGKTAGRGGSSERGDSGGKRLHPVE